MREFLQTEVGLVSRHAIILIEDHPINDSAEWPVHYQFGSEVRVTTADPDLIREFTRDHP